MSNYKLPLIILFGDNHNSFNFQGDNENNTLISNVFSEEGLPLRW